MTSPSQDFRYGPFTTRPDLVRLHAIGEYADYACRNRDHDANLTAAAASSSSRSRSRLAPAGSREEIRGKIEKSQATSPELVRTKYSEKVSQIPESPLST